MTDPQPNQSRPVGSDDPELTSAAQEVLERYLEGTRRQVLRDLEESHDAYSSVSRHRVSDVQEAIDRVQTRQELASPGINFLEALSYIVVSRQRTRNALILIIATATPIAIASVVLALAVNQRSWPVNFLAQVGLASSAVAAVAAVSRMLRHRLAARKRQGLVQQEFVKRFATLERSAQQFIAERENVPTTSVSISKLLSDLEAMGVWARSDVSEFRKILRLRNHLVHEDVSKVSDSDISFALAEIARLEDRMNLKSS